MADHRSGNGVEEFLFPTTPPIGDILISIPGVNESVLLGQFDPCVTLILSHYRCQMCDRLKQALMRKVSECHQDTLGRSKGNKE